MKAARLGLALVLTLVGLPAALAQDDNTPVLGTVTITTPEIYVEDQSGERRVFEPIPFEMGEILRTDATGNALITWFYDGTETALGPDSMLKLNEFTGASFNEFVINLELQQGHVVAALGDIASTSENAAWILTTPAFQIHPLSGQFETMVDDEGATTLIVIRGQVEYRTGEDDSRLIDAGQYLTAAPDNAPGDPQELSADGTTINLDGLCTATTRTNLNVRQAPNEDSRRLGGARTGQVFWVRSGTEGNLWLQIYYRIDNYDYGWVYGPALTLDDSTCADLIRPSLNARLFGGPGLSQGGE
jgi:hypothetical protein